MRVFGSDRGTFARLETGLRDLPYPASFRPFSAYEAEARSLRLFEHVLVPGLLQTAGYARAVLATRPHTSAEEIDELITARLARQALLARADPPLLYVLLDEGVLHRPVGTRDVMAAQLARLAELSEEAFVTPQVIPFSAGAHIGLQGGFAIAELPDLPAIVFLAAADLAAIIAQLDEAREIPGDDGPAAPGPPETGQPHLLSATAAPEPGQATAPRRPGQQPPPAGAAGQGAGPGPAGTLVRISVLGPLQITADGREIGTGLRKARELLAFLTIHGAGGATGEAISEALWPGPPPGHGTRQRNVALRQARELLRGATGLTTPM